VKINGCLLVFAVYLEIAHPFLGYWLNAGQNRVDQCPCWQACCLPLLFGMKKPMSNNCVGASMVYRRVGDRHALAATNSS
jgi:hypothetical protein